MSFSPPPGSGNSTTSTSPANLGGGTGGKPLIKMDGTVQAYLKSGVAVRPFSAAIASAANGLLGGSGLGVPGGWSGAVNALNSASAFTGKMTRMVNRANTSIALVNYARNNLAGAALMVAGGIVSSAAQAKGLDPNNVVISALRRGNELAKDPITFLKTLSKATPMAEASFTQGGTNALLRFTGSVGGLLRSVRTFTDLVTGGITGTVGPTVPNTIAAQRAAANGIQISANDVRQGLAAVSTALRGFGTLWDISSPATIGTAAGIIDSLTLQGIGEAIGLNDKLLAQGVDPTVGDLHINYSEIQLKEVLYTIRGAELNYILKTTGVTIYQKQGNLESARDLTEPGIVLPQVAIDNIPDASLPEFGRAIASWGITNNMTWAMIADVLDDLEIPDIPDINDFDPATTFGNLDQYLTSGSGLFGEAMLVDFIGTASGHVHAEATQALSGANETLQKSDEGKALAEALDYLSAHEDPSDPLNELATANVLGAMTALKNSASPEVQNALYQADQSTLDQALQVVAEVQNALIMGEALITTLDDLYAAIAVFAASSPPGSGTSTSAPALQTVATASISMQPADLWAGFMAALDGIFNVIDNLSGFIGMQDIIGPMITPDAAGQRMQAMLAEARNSQRLAALGVNTSASTPDVLGYARVKAALRGDGLTPQQKAVITTDAILRGLNPQDQIAMASLYGYDKRYYDGLLYG